MILAGRYRSAVAADAAALAAAPVTFRAFGAAGSPAGEAAIFASANGARLVSCACPVDRRWRRRSVTVVVERTVALLGAGSITIEASSTAEFDPVALLGQADSLPGQSGVDDGVGGERTANRQTGLANPG